MNRKQRRWAARQGATPERSSSSVVRELLADALRRRLAGRLDEAERDYRRILAIDPHHAESLHRLGVIADQAGRHEVAIDLLGQAIAINPTESAYHTNLGNALRALGRLDEAATGHRRALALNPDDAVARNNLGNVLRDQGKLTEAVACYESALALKPDYAMAHHNLGTALLAQNRLEEAVAQYERALTLRPGFAMGYGNLGSALIAQGKLEEAVECFSQALDLNPDDAQTRSNLLMCLNYTDRTAADIFAAHRQFGETAARALAASPPVHENGRNLDRRLRIGYVSADFKDHSVAWFFAPLLAAHDPAAVEVFCYAQVIQPDAVTERLKGQADHWVSTVGMSDQALAERIRADRIDILVDLAGHTAHNRLTMFALKPAPVQATWLGYPNTTGLAAMDWRLVDAVTDPPGEADAFATETLVRLEDGFLC
ncbi:MAG: tetratricopeptide repeat protein, partial [Caulobacterales bacterium]